MSCAWQALRAGPAGFREEREQHRAKAEAKKRHKAVEKKRNWEEKVKTTEGSED